MNESSKTLGSPRSARGGLPLRFLPIGMTTVLLAQALPARPAWAQDDASSSDTAAARSLAVDGVRLADAGRCSEAIDKLLRAEKLHHAPIVLGRLGECQVAQGKIVDGTENLRKVLREAVPPSAPAALLKARERAQGVLEAAKPKIATLTISVKGPRDTGSVIVTVDGQPVPTPLLDTDRPTDPGEHLIEASAVGFLKTSVRVALGPADKQAVNLKLEADPSAVAAPAAVASTSDSSPSLATRGAAPRDPDSSTSIDSALGGSTAPSHTAAYLAWGVGGVALATGAVFGGLALKGKSDLTSECRGTVCTPQSEDRLSSAKLNGTISTVGFAVGGGAIVIGTILYLASGSSSNSGSGSASVTRATRPSGWSARPWIGVGQVGLGGEF